MWAFKSAIFSLCFWARANLDARGDEQQPVRMRVWEDLKVGGDRCEILRWRDPASQFGVAVPAARGCSGSARAGLSQLLPRHQAGSVRGGARLKEKSLQGQDRMDCAGGCQVPAARLSRERLGTSWV